MWKHCTAAALSVALCLQAQRGAVRPEFTASQIGLASGYSAGWLWPGEAHSIYGKNLGPAQSCTRDAEQPLPTELCGVRVLIDEEPVPLLYVHERQVNFMAPGSGSSGGKVALRVVHEGVSSIPVACGIGRFLPSSACPHIEVTFNGLPLPELKAKTRPRRIRYSGPPCPNPTPGESLFISNTASTARYLSCAVCTGSETTLRGSTNRRAAEFRTGLAN